MTLWSARGSAATNGKPSARPRRRRSARSFRPTPPRPWPRRSCASRSPRPCPSTPKPPRRTPDPMILAILQILLVLAAGVALFLLWRAATPSQPWLRLVVAAGFLARALIGQALFWISWARLPIARGLQLGDGIWFFAEDAFLYVPAAASAAGKGVWAIVMIPRVEPSVMYIQALSAAMLLFGRAASVALLLNLFCYLGMVALLLRWGRNEPSAQTAVAVAIAGISLSPAVMLWSLQPLKDTFFQFLFVAFVFACAAWQQAWVTRGPARTRIAIGLLLPVLLYAIAGIRWYFAF